MSFLAGGKDPINSGEGTAENPPLGKGKKKQRWKKVLLAPAKTHRTRDRKSTGRLGSAPYRISLSQDIAEYPSLEKGEGEWKGGEKLSSPSTKTCRKETECSLEKTAPS